MRGFAERTTVEAALDWLDRQLSELDEEQVPLDGAAGRVLAGPVTSDFDVPGFDRAMMDGFAVRAEDTDGASAYNPLVLEEIGRALPGEPFDGSVTNGQAVRIMTGAPLPDGADAVLPAEWTECDDRRVAVHGAVSPGKHVGRRGEDVMAGATILRAGRVLRPQDLGLLSSIGAGIVSVVRRPRVAVLTTGNEVLPAGAAPRPNRIVDANGPMLAALVARDGGAVVRRSIVADDPQVLLTAMRGDDFDVLIVSGGSSVGEEDYAPRLLAQHGELAVHGIAMRPSSPTGMGRLAGRPVFLLPGNPVSCLCAYDFFAGRAVRVLGGRSADWPHRRVAAPLARKIASPIGRVDYMRVTMNDGRVEPLGTGGASILTTTTRADGFVIVPADSEGYPAGATVTVMLYD
jgi:molybdopterin molybdotransferase